MPCICTSAFAHLNLRLLFCKADGSGEEGGNHEQQSQCFDDDHFVATAFGNPDLTCAAVADQGLCSSLESSGIENRCCGSCGKNRRRNMGDDSEDITGHAAISLSSSAAAACKRNSSSRTLLSSWSASLRARSHPSPTA